MGRTVPALFRGGIAFRSAHLTLRIEHGSDFCYNAAMTANELLSEDRLLPADPGERAIARRLYGRVRALPIISPHGHTNPAWFADNEPFADPSSLLIIPDHYIFRMLYSQGVSLESVGVPRLDGAPSERDARAIWRLFASHWHLFRGTPSRTWFTHALHEVFGITERLGPASAERIYDRIADCLVRPEFRPRALFERFRIEVLATTESPLDALPHHKKIRESGWKGRVITAFRPDPVVDPEHVGFASNVAKLGAMAGENTETWAGYLRALANRRQYFASFGATSTDHGHPSAATFDLSTGQCEALLRKALAGDASPAEAEQFRGQMLTEMARMSIDDGLVMQIHPGSFRNHNPNLYRGFGPDKGADIPTATEYVRALKPLLDRFGNDKRLSLDRLHARRVRVLARAGAARRALPGAQAGARVVVFR